MMKGLVVIVRTTFELSFGSRNRRGDAQGWSELLDGRVHGRVLLRGGFVELRSRDSDPAQPMATPGMAFMSV
jgi:hypothetical protein